LEEDHGEEEEDEEEEEQDGFRVNTNSEVVNS